MIEVKCPKCGNTEFDCYDTDCDMNYTTHWNLCYCDECGTQFKIEYTAIGIEETEIEEDD